MNNNGEQQWLTEFGGPNNYVGAKDLAVDDSGNVYITGSVYGDLDGQTNNGVSNDVYITKYNNSGAKQWTRLFGSPYGDMAGGIAASSDGHVYVTGSINEASGNRWDVFIAKYTVAGSFIWQRTYGENNQSDEGNDIVVDAMGNIYITGETRRTADYYDYIDVYLARYNSAGVEVWTEFIGENKNDFGHSIAADSTGVYVTGYTFGDLYNYDSGHSGDAIVMKYSTSGSLQWNQKVDSQAGDREEGNGIAVDQTGNVYITGQTSGDLDNNTNAGGNDVFVIKYNSSGNQL